MARKGAVVMLPENRAVRAGWRRIMSPSAGGWNSLMGARDLDRAGQPSGGGGVRAMEVGEGWCPGSDLNGICKHCA